MANCLFAQGLSFLICKMGRMQSTSEIMRHSIWEGPTGHGPLQAISQVLRALWPQGKALSQRLIGLGRLVCTCSGLVLSLNVQAP